MLDGVPRLNARLMAGDGSWCSKSREDEGLRGVGEDCIVISLLPINRIVYTYVASQIDARAFESTLLRVLEIVACFNDCSGLC